MTQAVYLSAGVSITKVRFLYYNHDSNDTMCAGVSITKVRLLYYNYDSNDTSCLSVCRC